MVKLLSRNGFFFGYAILRETGWLIVCFEEVPKPHDFHSPGAQHSPTWSEAKHDVRGPADCACSLLR